jgi:hypothetical protein
MKLQVFVLHKFFAEIGGWHPEPIPSAPNIHIYRSAFVRTSLIILVRLV